MVAATSISDCDSQVYQRLPGCPVVLRFVALRVLSSSQLVISPLCRSAAGDVVAFQDMYGVLLVLALLVPLYLLRRPAAAGSPSRCLVVVQGDLCRSPRMQYHVLSLLKRGFHVDLLGYCANRDHLIPELLPFLTLNIVTLREVAFKPHGIIQYIFKVLVQTWFLLVALATCTKPRFMLMQNPPCIPTMAVLALFRLVWNCSLVYDWHNYGYTILGLSVGQKHPLYRISKVYERLLGKCADDNICVTSAMCQDLLSNWGIEATTLYDKAPSRFRELQSAERKHFLESCAFLQGEELSGKAVIVSSTSWTPDEDFSILLNALVEYDKSASASNDLPKLVCLITGKGPEKEFYVGKIAELSLSKVTIKTPWLEADDYPKLIGSADLGVCLHTSSSGLDLPMKVVDMFGCNLPVCAMQFECISELVQDDVNGLLFTDSSQLAAHLQRLFHSSNQQRDLLRMRSHLRHSSGHRWDQEWDSKFLPILNKL